MSYEAYEVRVHDNDDICWYLDGKLHRVDGPAIIRANGDQEWYQAGKRHRVDGPAVTSAYDTKEWYLDGKLHRVDGPAIILADGYKAWYQAGRLHRVDGPAMTWVDGAESWYFHGKRHRVDGPAIICANGTKYWYLDGKKLSEAEHQTCTQKQPKSNCQGQTVVIDGANINLIKEGDELVADPETGAKKADGNKNRLDLLPTRALEQIGLVLTYGADKYGSSNWRAGMDYSRLTGAVLRHLFAWMREEETDPETGLNHIAHAATNLLFLLEMLITSTGTDTRYKYKNINKDELDANR